MKWKSWFKKNRKFDELFIKVDLDALCRCRSKRADWIYNSKVKWWVLFYPKNVVNTLVYTTACKWNCSTYKPQKIHTLLSCSQRGKNNLTYWAYHPRFIWAMIFVYWEWEDTVNNINTLNIVSINDTQIRSSNVSVTLPCHGSSDLQIHSTPDFNEFN